MLFIDDEYQTGADFYHGDTRYADKDGTYEPDYDGIDTLMLYTLTPGVTSSFKNIQICSQYCKPTDE